jgi:5-methylcytosine-specific restriction enzyme subunit McrC
MQTVQLREGESSRVRTFLDGEQLEILRRARVEVRPAVVAGAQPGAVWEFSAGTYIGVFQCGDLNVVIRPRIPMDQVMFLVGYSLSPGDWSPSPFPLSPDDDILEAIIPAFVRLTQDAIRRGILKGYRTHEVALSAVQGRIRLADQVRKRFGFPVPVEVTYDDYTEDIEENRLLKTAIGVLWSMPIRSTEARRELGALRPAFASVSRCSYSPNLIPSVSYTRLNQRYRPAVELARLIIGSSLAEFAPGEKIGTSFLVDMDRVFETFLRTALRQALRLSESEWPARPSPSRALHLEEAGQVQVNPGLSWWRGRRCLFVGDARYGRPKGGVGEFDGQQADIYRMLACCTAADLPSGLLVYAEGGEGSAVHRIRNTGKAIESVSVDLQGTPQDTLEQVRVLAERVRAHRDGALAVA